MLEKYGIDIFKCPYCPMKNENSGNIPILSIPNERLSKVAKNNRPKNKASPL